MIHKGTEVRVCDEVRIDHEDRFHWLERENPEDPSRAKGLTLTYVLDARPKLGSIAQILFDVECSVVDGYPDIMEPLPDKAPDQDLDQRLPGNVD